MSFPEISHVIGGVKTTVKGYVFEEISGGFKLIRDQIGTKNDDLDHLANCLVGWTGEIPLIRSGALDSIKKVEQLFFLIKKISQPQQQLFRLSSTQIDSVEFKGDAIQKQHFALFHTDQKFKDLTLTHLLFPLENGESKKHKLQTIVEAYERIPRWLNMEAWVQYCAWYQEKLEEAFAHFRYDAIDEYTLEGYITSFRHEVFSNFLEKTRARLEQLQLLPNSEHFDSYQELLAKEKEILGLRRELRRMVHAHYDNLVQIVRTIQTIEETYPNLIPLKRTGQMLEMLLADQVQAFTEATQPLNWGVAQMLLQLLNEEFGVISAVNDQEGFSITNFAFSLRLSIMQLGQQYAKDEIIDLVLNGVEIAKANNIMIAKEAEKFHQWLKNPEISEISKKRALLMEELRANFLENMICFSLKKETEDKVLNENLIPLYFLPFHLVKVNPASGEPIGLTDEGFNVLTSL